MPSPSPRGFLVDVAKNSGAWLRTGMSVAKVLRLRSNHEDRTPHPSVCQVPILSATQRRYERPPVRMIQTSAFMRPRVRLISTATSTEAGIFRFHRLPSPCARLVAAFTQRNERVNTERSVRLRHSPLTWHPAKRR